MALEATLVFETELPLPFTVNNATNVLKGTVMKMADLMTAAPSDGDADIVAGILHGEKTASDGKTKAAVYRGGIFKMTAGGSITVGDALITNASSGAANEVITAGVNAENILGIALETATDTQTLLVMLGPRTINVA